MDCDLALIGRILARSHRHQHHHHFALIGWVIIFGLAARSNGTISSVPQNSDLAYVGRIHCLALISRAILFLPGIIVILMCPNKVTTLIVRVI